MRLIMLGAPGAGKGSVSELVVQKYGIPQISTGDMLRSAVRAGTSLGSEADGYMKRGELVPDRIILGLIEERLKADDCRNGFILDGFPRTIPQAEALKSILKKMGIAFDAIVNLDVPRDVIMRRLTSRRTCSNPDCQAIFNIHTKPSKKEGICDKCGSPTVQRNDETEAAITQRLKTYEEKTSPLIGFYKNDPAYVSLPCIDAKDTLNDIIAFVDGK